MSERGDYIIRVDSGERPGIIADVTAKLKNFGLNIVGRMGHDRSDDRARCFLRIVVEGSLDIEETKAALEETAVQPAIIEIHPDAAQDIVVLASDEPHCVADLLAQQLSGQLFANIRAVISDKPDLESLVKGFNVPFHYIATTGLKRRTHETRVERVLDEIPHEWLVAARYMRILTPEFVGPRKNKIINVHHSLLPAFVGKDPYEQAFRRGVKEIGATGHFIIAQHGTDADTGTAVIDGLDEGPIIESANSSVRHARTIEEFKEVGRSNEVTALSRTLSYVLRHRVFEYQNKAYVLY